MYLLDNFIKDKFLEDISELLKKYKIEDDIELLQNITRNLLFRQHSREFNKEFSKIYNNLYQRNFTILEVLAVKQQLEKERQVFSIVKNYISLTKTKFEWTEVLNTFISYKNQELIQHPHPILLFAEYDPEPNQNHPYYQKFLREYFGVDIILEN